MKLITKNHLRKGLNLCQFIEIFVEHYVSQWVMFRLEIVKISLQARCFQLAIQLTCIFVFLNFVLQDLLQNKILARKLKMACITMVTVVQQYRMLPQLKLARVNVMPIQRAWDGHIKVVLRSVGLKLQFETQSTVHSIQVDLVLVSHRDKSFVAVLFS